jgi:hypothetical protein
MAREKSPQSFGTARIWLIVGEIVKLSSRVKDEE